MIDNINRRIIAALKNDGRCSYAGLAKELGLNVIAIKAVLNPFTLGYKAQALIALDIDLTKIDQISTELMRSPNISLLVTVFGRFDMLVIADFPTWEMLQDFISKGLPKVEGINKIDVFPVIEIKKIFYGLFKYDAFVREPSRIDKIDLAIIEELGENGRLSYTDLASKLNISLTMVSRRVARLKEENIMRISAIRNPAKLGYLANAYVSLRADLNQIDAICSELAVYHEIHMIMTLMSGYEILLGIHFPGPEVLYKFIGDNIAGIPGVTHIETFICAETLKRSYAFFDPDHGQEEPSPLPLRALPGEFST
jgi:Lrp/AsnC family transcriptional regulator for asnA, asnC and gidA